MELGLRSGSPSMARYREIADQLVERVDKALLRPGDRVPSIREVTRRDRVSPGTAIRAYRDLEARGLIESRPRSGYFVRRVYPRQLPEPAPFTSHFRSTSVDVFDFVFEVFEGIKRSATVVQFGSPFLTPELLAIEQLDRAGAAAA